ncbi:hypothetical protein NRP93_003377 [Clostridium botulinum]|nr:hypothetical protein [Clostridium botulinum]
MYFFTNQYLIVDKELKVKLNNDTNSIKWENYYIFYKDPLLVNTYSHNDISIVVLGYIIDPINTNYSNKDIVRNVCEKTNDINSIFYEFQKYSGRFVVVIKNKNNIIAFSDACSSRQIYYFDSKKIISSSPELILEVLDEKINIGEDTLKVINSNKFRKSSFAWYGEQWYDKRIKKVLPNHHINMCNMKVYRNPVKYINFKNDEEIIEYAIKILTGSINALEKRYNIMQPITAGYDSRLVLAASKQCKENINYYIFDREDEGNNSADVYIASKLSERLNIKLNVIVPKKLDNNFLEKFNNIAYLPRIISTTSNIQYNYYNNLNKNIVNINGSCSEILRCYYPYDTKKKVTIKQLNIISGFKGFFNEEVKKWYEDAWEFCDNNNINILDLFYWEQRVGNWSSLYTFEQDISTVEEFSPFNNKNLLLSLLKLDLKYRMPPDYILYKKIMEILWPEVLMEPFNPQNKKDFKSTIKNSIRSNSRFYYMCKKINDYLTM